MFSEQSRRDHEAGCTGSGCIICSLSETIDMLYAKIDEFGDCLDLIWALKEGCTSNQVSTTPIQSQEDHQESCTNAECPLCKTMSAVAELQIQLEEVETNSELIYELIQKSHP